MRIAYLVHSHKNVAQVRRLVQTLRTLDPESLVLVSHDTAGDPGIEEALEGLAPVTREPGGRGGFHPIQRWLAGVELVRERGGADYVCLVSGQDYPVRGLQAMHDDLIASGDGFIEDFPALVVEGNHWPLREGRSRYLFRWRELFPISNRTRNLLYATHALNRVQPWVRVNVAYGSLRLGLRGASIPDGFECRGGSMFTTVSWRLADYVATIARERPDVMSWARDVLVIDEAFVQTIASGNPEFTFFRDARRFYLFEDSRFGHPKVLEEGDVAAAADSGAYFARKFDLALAPEALDRADELLGIVGN